MISKKTQSEFGEVEIAGTCDSAFNEVLEEFESNFRERGELGASVCVTREGKTVVDLWGGLADAETRKPWTRDTISIVWSSTKGAAAVSMHVLASRGLVDLDAPVVKYWPEFGKKGKETTLVKMFLDHSAGLPHVKEKLPQDAFFDWEIMAKALEDAELWWEPGTRTGYHAFTKGWLNGEIVRRVTGQSIGAFFRKEIGDPLDLDFWIGLPETHDSRVAKIIFPEQGDPPADFFIKVETEPEGIQSMIFTNEGGFMGTFETMAARRAEIPAAGGIANARGLAGLYAPLACGGKLGGVELVDSDTLARMGAVSSASGLDASLLVPMRFALGFTKAMDNRRGKPGNQDTILMSEDAFGCPGFGGSIGLADPVAGMSFGYSMNRMGPGTALNPRGQSLLDATYRALGYTSSASGRWIK
jgi:CubicO group peptidase (beta-lactamase class C family)